MTPQQIKPAKPDPKPRRFEMFKKTLLTAAAALAITAGATTFSTPDANANGFNLNIGFYGGHHYGHHGYGYGYGYGYGCHVKYYKKYKVKKWTHHGPVWVWVSKPVYSCH